LVAIKTGNPENSSEDNLLTLFDEIKVMCHLGIHKHIVGLVGASTVRIKERKLFALCEFCPLGSLLNHLRSTRSEFVNLVRDNCIDCSIASDSTRKGVDIDNVSFSSQNLILWSFQISKGMEYLSEKKAISPNIVQIKIEC
jgi:serine/threonine protein kinase